MQVSDIRNETRFITRTDSSTYADADILTGMNIYNGEILQKILKVEGVRNSFIKNSTTTLLSYQNLTQGQPGYLGEFPMPTDCLRPIRVEVSYDGITWLPAKPYDINAGNMTSEYNPNQINSAFQTTSNPNYNPYISTPYVRYERDSFFIRPLNQNGNVLNGIVIWYEARQVALINDTDIPAFESNFHDILVLKLAIRYAKKFPEKYNPVWKQELAELENDMMEYYRNRFKFNSTMTASFERFK